MSPYELLLELRCLGTEVARDGGRIRFRAPRGAVSEEYREATRRQKGDLLALLRDEEACAVLSEVAGLEFEICVDEEGIRVYDLTRRTRDGSFRRGELRLPARLLFSLAEHRAEVIARLSRKNDISKEIDMEIQDDGLDRVIKPLEQAQGGCRSEHSDYLDGFLRTGQGIGSSDGAYLERLIHVDHCAGVLKRSLLYPGEYPELPLQSDAASEVRVIRKILVRAHALTLTAIDQINNEGPSANTTREVLVSTLSMLDVLNSYLREVLHPTPAPIGDGGF